MKTIEEMIAVMQAYADGKKIEVREIDPFEEIVTPLRVCDPIWNWVHCDYRIKPEPKYRPYANAEECFADVKKHGGWIDGVMCDHHKAMITYISNDAVYTSALTTAATRFEDLLNNFHWADDGTPCGVLEEE